MSQNNQLVSKALEIQQNTLENSQKALSDAVELPMKQSIELQKNAAKLFLDGLEMTNYMQNRNTELTRDAFTSYIDSVEDTMQDTAELAEQGIQGAASMGQQTLQQSRPDQYQSAGQQQGQPQQYQQQPQQYQQQPQQYQQPPQQYQQPPQQYQQPPQQPQTRAQQSQTTAQQPQQTQPQSAQQRPPTQPPTQGTPSRQQQPQPPQQSQQPPTSQYASQQYRQQPAQQSSTVQGQIPSMGFQTEFSTQTPQPAGQQSTTQPPRQPMTVPPERQEEGAQNRSPGAEGETERTETPADTA